VEVIGGYLTGLKGYIIRGAKNQKNVVIELKHIGFQLRLQIDPAYLRRVNKLGAKVLACRIADTLLKLVTLRVKVRIAVSESLSSNSF